MNLLKIVFKEVGVTPTLCRNRIAGKLAILLSRARKKMTAESPKDTVSRFSQNWDEKDINSLVAEFLSISKETNRKPDTYHFIVDEGQLLDPNTNRPILEFIAEGVEKDVARSLGSWASKNDEGLALWISPSKEKVYPCPKIIVHQIAYTPEGKKVVLNSAILFDSRTEIINPEFKRGKLYSFADTNENILKIFSFIKRKSGKSVNHDPEANNTAKKAAYFANRIKLGIPKNIVIQEMIMSGFIGSKPISCPGNSSMSLSNFMSENSFIVNSSKQERWSYKKGKCVDPDHQEDPEDSECHYVGPCNICKKCERRYN